MCVAIRTIDSGHEERLRTRCPRRAVEIHATQVRGGVCRRLRLVCLRSLVLRRVYRRWTENQAMVGGNHTKSSEASARTSFWLAGGQRSAWEPVRS